ncbi:hypothetical protein E3P92_01433 [Wallemia ichthyophaga]|uniref:Uncharacterized protein n=2 Tax=Wallemia ichthyophaga TaxID=245174 RepID=A0A4T0EIF0_WALIC|nr:uncharacterized protein J056_000876 [Wallemia ichthyophaga EXF-994]TIA73999.1 hypothetical protein E3P91_01172 [Wallemia ichthyophaga]EOR00338.1 hypothetical protein J056_000876 [Wallemia ichthyophaga EXF-994]TIA82631.1 hypothetical protein E3P98_01312 [Wallemia ichthyophaga]TIA92456.1 hypothetical protein E3P97_01478 [Wallemia ichthyophaga]TIB01482.1 hypothetical protein E3P95_01314 [Wallemia ichthyophaga]
MTGGMSKVDQQWGKTDNQLPDHSHRQPGAPYETGQTHSHKTGDSHDQQSIANKLAGTSHLEKEERKAEKEGGKPPTAPAVWHGNEPSKGAKVDEDLGKEDEKVLHKKGLA